MADVDIVPLFISIDVRRDTFEEINEYCEVISELINLIAKYIILELPSIVNRPFRD